MASLKTTRAKTCCKEEGHISSATICLRNQTCHDLNQALCLRSQIFHNLPPYRPQSSVGLLDSKGPQNTVGKDPIKNCSSLMWQTICKHIFWTHETYETHNSQRFPAFSCGRVRLMFSGRISCVCVCVLTFPELFRVCSVDARRFLCFPISFELPCLVRVPSLWGFQCHMVILVINWIKRHINNIFGPGGHKPYFSGPGALNHISRPRSPSSKSGTCFNASVCFFFLLHRTCMRRWVKTLYHR